MKISKVPGNVQNTFFKSVFFKSVFVKHTSADAKNTSLPGTFYGHIECAWESADAKKFFARLFFTKILKVPGEVRKQRTLFARHFFYENIKSAWESADAKNTFLAGTLRKYRTLFINKHIISALKFDKNCLG